MNLRSAAVTPFTIMRSSLIPVEIIAVYARPLELLIGLTFLPLTRNTTPEVCVVPGNNMDTFEFYFLLMVAPSKLPLIMDAVVVGINDPTIEAP